ncbi:MAG TPA: 6-phosphogluconolactonase [Aquiluna sp.]
MTIRSTGNPKALIDAASQDFAELANQLLASKKQIRVLLTGGTLGIEFIAQLGKLDLDFSRIWLMFSDERFVALNHPDRNEQQGISAWPELANHLVRFPGPEMTLLSARDVAESEIKQLDLEHTSFDLTVLGMGPDAHVASLFPGHEAKGEWVIAEPDSPKPPSERLSLSYQALNRSERVWFLAAGESKIWAVSQSLRADSGLPAARVRGISETVWYLDSEITDAL